MLQTRICKIRFLTKQLTYFLPCRQFRSPILSSKNRLYKHSKFLQKQNLTQKPPEQMRTPPSIPASSYRRSKTIFCYKKIGIYTKFSPQHKMISLMRCELPPRNQLKSLCPHVFNRYQTSQPTLYSSLSLDINRSSPLQQPPIPPDLAFAPQNDISTQTPHQDRAAVWGHPPPISC